ncbi:DUF6538 domain-containing protein [Roseococcus sp.]|uniref:DUF6538 domain-containing protein n=1 Tax=Roseococcus sp. TaxID=2109646 RepID=UPI003BA956A9
MEDADVAKLPYLRQGKDRNWTIRRIVPPELRPVVGKRELWASLRTPDKKIAAKRYHPAMVELEAELERARHTLAAVSPPAEPTEADIRAAIRRRFALADREAEAADAHALATGMADVLIDHRREDSAHLTNLASAFEEAGASVTAETLHRVATPDPADKKPIVSTVAGARPKRIDALMHAHRFGNVPDPLRLYAARLLLAAEAENAARSLHRLGDHAAPPPHPAFLDLHGLMEAPPAPAPPARPLPAAELVKAWAAERKPTERTQKAAERRFAQLAKFLGYDDLRRVAKLDAGNWKADLLEKGLGVKTVRDCLLSLSAVCALAVANGKLESNPFAGVAPPQPRKDASTSRRGYTDREAATLLGAARAERGFLRVAAPALCFTGMRISELVGLRRQDLREVDGVLIFDIVPTPERPLKTAAARRMVPVHPALLPDLMAYRAALLSPDDPAGPLFPDIKSKRGDRVGLATKRMSVWVRSAGVTDTRTAPAHSFRHRLKRSLVTLRVLPHVQDALLGHEGRHGSGDAYLEPLSEQPAETLKDLRRVPDPLNPE